MGWLSRGLLLGALLLTTGCVTLPGLSGDTRGPRVLVPGASAPSWPGTSDEETRRPAPGVRAGVPPGWPDYSGSGEALLAPFLACASPAELLALQEAVDMPRLLEALDDWRAVRLGAQGPLREDAASILNRKRTAFLLNALERYGAERAEVLSLFLVHSAHDDDLREVLSLLARDKQLAEVLELLPAFAEALERRGLKPTARADRDFEWKDLGRGLARAGRDALSSSPLSEGARALDFSSLRGQLPPAYQEALDGIETSAVERHFSAGRVVLGGVDQLTFGVPLGFYGLLAGTGQGMSSLARGHYERATRELAPAALLVALYSGGRGARALSEARGAPGTGARFRPSLEAVEARWRGLRETAERLRAQLQDEGVRELSHYLQASREAGRFVAEGGLEAALVLHEARGDVARARPMMARGRPSAGGPSAPRVLEGLAALVDAEAGLTQEVVEAKLAVVESDTPGPRLSRDVVLLERQRPALDAPPVGAEASSRWKEYVAYYERRLGDVRQGLSVEGPLRWAPYERMWGYFTRGLAFERNMVNQLRADARLPRAQRRFLGDFDRPRVETYVGVKKPDTGLRFADVLVIEEAESAGWPRRVETLSFKSRDFSTLQGKRLEAQLLADAKEARGKYGGTLDIRRVSLRPLLPESSQITVQRIRLVYESSSKGMNVEAMTDAVNTTEQWVPGVEILFQ